MPLPLVTIIALCHNHAPFLREALTSIEQLDYPALEVWLVDNGSTDGSPALLRAYAQAHPGWHLLLLPENLGNCRAFNQAFWQSRGEFVVDFATDDVLLPQRLRQQVALFQALPADYGMVYSNCELLRENGEPLGFYYQPTGRGGLRPAPASGWVFREVLARFFISTPTMLMRRTCLAALGGYDERLSYEDFDFWVRASRDWRFQYQDAVTTRKRLHPRSLSAQTTRRHNPHLASTLAVCAKALGLCRTRAEYRALASRLRYELAHALRRGQWAEARRAARLLVQVVGRVVGGRGQA
ncbi:glycosyltransferase family 2 protein [Hymenobacter sp. RP-2-7]|uniref:Glycosyltransferase family 2 protein n=1 Tax=Hymenobacter polaris TaxID=2682546 RepID=A0A7Y0AC76_9BACT|nr:glycosyltransferase family A protein [Hymenobacter polaris]NML64660.1 glycosyltransferase family 2 protein [Hymenobacter polaris]